jgi:hypothetical protein
LGSSIKKANQKGKIPWTTGTPKTTIRRRFKARSKALGKVVYDDNLDKLSLSIT